MDGMDNIYNVRGCVCFTMPLDKSCKIFNAEDIVDRAGKFHVSITFVKTFEIRLRNQTNCSIHRSAGRYTDINLHYKKSEFQLSELLAPL